MKSMQINKQNILDAFRTRSRKSLSFRELMVALQLPASAKKSFHVKLRELERQGVLKRIRGGRYALVENKSAAEGIVRLGKRGDGWVELPDGKSVRIAARNLSGALDGDRINYVLLRRDRMNRLNGRVVGIVEHVEKIVIGQFQQGRDNAFILPIDMSFQQPIVVEVDRTLRPQSGDWVAVRLAAHSRRMKKRQGEILEVLGSPADPRVEMLATACRHDIPLHFSRIVQQEASAVPTRLAETDLEERTDLRHLPFVTIDGETAKDFDDAVTLLQDGGKYRLYVAIADVGHYVPSGSAIDQAAMQRGTSVYFPGYCLPMLPEELSNNICSLKPEVDRLVMVAEIVFDRSGVRRAAEFYPAIICSKARLTYQQVQAFLDGDAETSGAKADAVTGQLLPMLELSKRLTALRMQRGSFELEIPEPEICLDDAGKPESIVLAQRLASHHIIEEFMLAANEAVADFLAENKRELPYRIHEEPDAADFAGLNNYLKACGRKEVRSSLKTDNEINQLLQEIENGSERKIVSRLVLQSMKQARYSVDNVGHYGLAATRYCHFTSPIRRYPDLLVHRILKQCLAGKKLFSDKDKLSQLADLSSRRERLAVDAERDVQAMLICRFMQDKTGNHYSGIISSVQKFGFFVELDDCPVEGLVHIASLVDDYYFYEQDFGRLVGERTGNIFVVGKSVKISVENVNISRREIDFRLISTGAEHKAGDLKRKRRRQKQWR